jgi:hypothetical protein
VSRRAYIYFVLTFILGVLVGSALTLIYGWHSGRWRHRPPSRQWIVAHLTHDLNLSSAQASQVNQIVEDDMVKIQGLEKQMEPQVAAIRKQGRNRIRQILNPTQLAKFNAMVAGWHARMKKREGH